MLIRMKTPFANAFDEKRFDKADSFALKHFQEKENGPWSTLDKILRRKRDGISAEKRKR